jgi:hypothetical protein
MTSRIQIEPAPRHELESQIAVDYPPEVRAQPSSALSKLPMAVFFRGTTALKCNIRLGTFRPLGDWVFDKERQNEIYLEAAIRTERWNAAVRQRRVGERRGRLAVPKQGRVGIARCQIGLA